MLAPPDPFLRSECMDGAVWRALAGESLFVVNCIGPEAHVALVKSTICKYGAPQQQLRDGCLDHMENVFANFPFLEVNTHMLWLK